MTRMTKQRYDQIRNTKEFLYTYFVEESKSKVSPQEFNNSLQMWFLMMGQVDISNAVATVVRYLDNINRS